MLWLLLTAAQAASPWIDVNADVIAHQTVAASPESTFEHVMDLQNQAELLPEDCVTRWVFGVQTAGVGATARLTYVPSVLRRRLGATITRADQDIPEIGAYLLEIEHPGNRGFVTRWEIAPADPTGSEVTVTTYLNNPPWPFREIYHLQIKPAWEACYTTALTKLDEALPAQPPPPLEAPQPVEDVNAIEDSNPEATLEEPLDAPAPETDDSL